MQIEEFQNSWSRATRGKWWFWEKASPVDLSDNKSTWEECVEQDLKVCGLSEAGTQDRLSWRSSVKNSRQEPTPSNGSLPQSMAAPPARRVLGMRTRSFNKTGFDWLIDWLIDVPKAMLWTHVQSFSLKSHHKCDFWHCIFSRDYFEEFAKHSWNNPRVFCTDFETIYWNFVNFDKSLSPLHCWNIVACSPFY